MQADEPVLLNENAPVTDILTAFYSGGARQRHRPCPVRNSARVAALGLPPAALPFNTAYKYSAKSFGAQGKVMS